MGLFGASHKDIEQDQLDHLTEIEGDLKRLTTNLHEAHQIIASFKTANAANDSLNVEVFNDRLKDHLLDIKKLLARMEEHNKLLLEDEKEREEGFEIEYENSDAKKRFEALTKQGFNIDKHKLRIPTGHIYNHNSGKGKGVVVIACDRNIFNGVIITCIPDVGKKSRYGVSQERKSDTIYF